ncbi:MAG: SPOR domain-containing protein [Spirochaetia bacterium]
MRKITGHIFINSAVISIVLTILTAVNLYSQESPMGRKWEGLAAVSTEGEFPSIGYYGASDAFPRNSIVKVTNKANGNSIRLVVTKELNDSNLFIVLSQEAGKDLGISTRETIQVSVTPVSVAGWGAVSPVEDVPYHPDPDINPSAGTGDPNRDVLKGNGEPAAEEDSIGVLLTEELPEKTKEPSKSVLEQSAPDLQDGLDSLGFEADTSPPVLTLEDRDSMLKIASESGIPRETPETEGEAEPGEPDTPLLGSLSGADTEKPSGIGENVTPEKYAEARKPEGEDEPAVTGDVPAEEGPLLGQNGDDTERDQPMLGSSVKRPETEPEIKPEPALETTDTPEVTILSPREPEAELPEKTSEPETEISEEAPDTDSLAPKRPRTADTAAAVLDEPDTPPQEEPEETPEERPAAPAYAEGSDTDRLEQALSRAERRISVKDPFPPPREERSFELISPPPAKDEYTIDEEAIAEADPPETLLEKPDPGIRKPDVEEKETEPYLAEAEIHEKDETEPEDTEPEPAEETAPVLSKDYLSPLRKAAEDFSITLREAIPEETESVSLADLKRLKTATEELIITLDEAIPREESGPEAPVVADLKRLRGEAEELVAQLIEAAPIDEPAAPEESEGPFLSDLEYLRQEDQDVSPELAEAVPKESVESDRPVLTDIRRLRRQAEEVVTRLIEAVPADTEESFDMSVEPEIVKPRTEEESAVAGIPEPERAEPDAGGIGARTPEEERETDVAAAEPSVPERTEERDAPSEDGILDKPIPEDAELALEPAEHRPPEVPEPESEDSLSRAAPEGDSEEVAAALPESPAPKVEEKQEEEPAAVISEEAVDSLIGELEAAVAAETKKEEPDTAAAGRLPIVKNLNKGSYYLQVGVYADPRTAQEALNSMQKGFPTAVTTASSEGKEVYKVLVGPLSEDEQGSVLYWLRSKGYRDAFVKRVSD